MATAFVPIESDIFDGIVVHFSPTTKLQDAQLPAAVAANGGLVVSNLNEKVSYLVCDVNDTGPTVAEARSLNVKLISEKYFSDSIKVGSLRLEDKYLIDNIKKKTTNKTQSGGTSTKKTGVPPVDSFCPYATASHIYFENGTYWCCTLNQTQVGKNSNKFYKIELIESNSTPHKYSVWTRWGRVGYTGSNALLRCGDLAEAKDTFEKKFYEKTNNHWSNKDNFTPKPNKYTLIDVELSSQDNNSNEDEKNTSPDNEEEIPSKLDPRVQDLVQMIFDRKMMNNTVMAMNYDVKKMPLGKLSKKTIKSAFSVLKEIEDILKASPGGKCNSPKIVDLSNRFYTLIPHSVGMQRLPYIDNLDILKEKLQLLQTLEDIEIANKVKADEDEKSAGIKMNPIDRQYHSLKIKLTPMERSNPLFPVLEKYVYNTHAPTHNQYTLKVLDIFEVEREEETKAFQKYVSLHNQQLLWHGSRMSNWVGILSQGLRIAPPEAPVTGYMFGKGVYFADLSSKSANYCHTTPKDPIGLLLLCQVALGTTWDKTQAYFVTKLPSQYHSVRGLGKSEPDPKDKFVCSDGVIIPYGKPVPNPNVTDSELLYNELIVYDVAQIRMRYLVKLRFNWK